MHDPFFFGYGSLVNRETHDYPDARPALITGWRREWRRSHEFGRTFLSAVRDDSAQIDGLIARVPRGDWAALDKREAGYARHRETAISNDHPIAAQIYALDLQVSDLPCTAHPIKLSYLDVVAAGFLREFSEQGVTRFFETTTGWSAALDDRASPLYARARPVPARVRQMVDYYLGALKVDVIDQCAPQ